MRLLPFPFASHSLSKQAQHVSGQNCIFFWQFLFLYREREKRLCSCFHFTWTLLGLGVMYSYRKPALHCICFALIVSGKWHLICCLFCCSTLAVINLCPLLLFFFFLYIYFCSTHLHLLFIINVYSIIYCLTTRRHVYIFNLCIILLNCVIEWGWLRINHSTLIAAANWVNNNYNTATTITVLVTRLAHSLASLTPLSYTHRHILTLICINWAQNKHED